MLKPVILVILDGWGEWDVEKGNPLKKALLPTIDRLNKYYPKTLLQASGLAVGLPWGVRGNSEVGHQTIGTGQIIFQYLPAISAAIGDGSFFNSPALLEAFDRTMRHSSNLHFFGLLSDGSVHSHIDHLFALLEAAKRNKIKEVFIHVVTDGRDTHPQSAKKYIVSLQAKMAELGLGKIATLCGRYYAMDRNNNWERTEESFSVMTAGSGLKEKNPLLAVDFQYEKNIFDEYLKPVNLIDENDQPIGLIKDNDTIICFNYREDRSRQMARAFILPDFKEFVAPRPKNIKYICFTEYEEGLTKDVVFRPDKITVRLGEILSKKGLKQLRVAETEKYAHVTYFFNGGLEKPYAGEDHLLIPSKKVSTYATVPEMSAEEITEKILEAVDQNKYDFILVNYANSDMVGHTGNFVSAVKAVETVDSCLSRLIDKVISLRGSLLITADHGNVEELVNIHTGDTDTQHSKNPVPCWYVTLDNNIEYKEALEPSIDGMLVDLAPTILDILKISKPKDMVGRSLLPLFGEVKKEE
ncbi:MAG: 2,3-bisphosphoglycerate-independent phosphoglycerate mutase [Patescibacteria group bacterium]|jgi:2,3-bisphosphoglycerate-independent phosphoglycerate mutase